MRDMQTLEKGQVFWFDPMSYRKMDGKFINEQNQILSSSLMMKTRPYVVVATNKIFSNICTVCPMSSSDINKNNLYNTFRLKIDNDDCWKNDKPYNFHDTSVIIDQPMTIDVGALQNYIGQLSDDIVNKIDVLITQYFGITLDGFEQIYKFFDTYFEEKYEEIKEKIVQEMKVDNTASEKFVSLMIEKMESKLAIKVDNISEPVEQSIEPNEPVINKEKKEDIVDDIKAEEKPKSASNTTKPKKPRAKHTTWSKERMEKLLDDKNSGFTEQELMELYDIKELSTLRTRISRAKKILGRSVTRKNKGLSYFLNLPKETLKEFYNDKKNRMPINDIKSKYHINSYSTLYRLFKTLEDEYLNEEVKA